ncbi:hypothetical protein I79_014779 [Cricetulus griseus]|uniref:Uncharacterized protein n=1 Tax=Cricetulus griseus TaxID=10029 RepID=G3HV06_CRIGR|nr:hypothetical protein I79_014779 [Cricetulus griseus]
MTLSSLLPDYLPHCSLSLCQFLSLTGLISHIRTMISAHSEHSVTVHSTHLWPHRSCATDLTCTSCDHTSQGQVQLWATHVPDPAEVWQ